MLRSLFGPCYFSFLFFLSPFSISVALSQAPSPTGLETISGKPNVAAYTRTDFNADPQFWTACEDTDGILFFGNNDGALVFDGQHWQMVELPNRSSVRSLIYHQGRVYAGGYNEIGLIVRDNEGRYHYQSLIDSLNLGNTHLEMAWQVESISNYLIFRFADRLLIVNGANSVTVPSKTGLLYGYACRDRYFVQDANLDLLELDLQSYQLLPFISKAQLGNHEIVELMPMGEKEALVGVARNGDLLKINSDRKVAEQVQNVFDNAPTDQILCASTDYKGTYFLGTLTGKLLIAGNQNTDGKFTWKSELSEEKSILNIFNDRKGNPWLLLNNGLDYIDLKSRMAVLFDQASVYDVQEAGNTIYIATNQGVFYANTNEISDVKFQKIQGLEGQTWTLSKIGNAVIASHDKGLFQLSGRKFTRIGTVNGVWKILPYPERENTWLVCTYHGIYLLVAKNGKLEISDKIQGFDESPRDILAAKKPNTFWVCHGYIGVFRLSLSSDLKNVVSLEHFTNKNGLPSQFNVNVFRWQDDIVFTTNQGVYAFDEKSNSFKPYAALNNILGTDVNHRKLLVAYGNTWFFNDDELGYFETGKSDPELHIALFEQTKGTFNRGMECILPLNLNEVAVGTNAGLYRFRLDKIQSDTLLKTLLTAATYHVAGSDTPRFLSLESGSINLPASTMGLHFNFAAPELNKTIEQLFSTRLEGRDDSWSAWQPKNAQEFTQLPPGQYTFHVKGRSITGEETSPASFSFSVLPFWYQTNWALTIFILIGLGVLYLIYVLIAKKIRREHEREHLKSAEAKRLLELEIERLTLKREKAEVDQKQALLKEDVLEKSKELANYTMELVQKKEVFSEMKTDLRALRDQVRGEKPKLQIAEMFRKLNQHEIGEDYMKVFDVNFERIHHHFFESLLGYCADLSRRELRLCAFIKMNLSNKEISPLLNISVRGVETARYRIRKKLDLEHERNLVAFLEGLG